GGHPLQGWSLEFDESSPYPDDEMGVPMVASVKTDCTPAGVAIYLATLAPFVLVFIAGGLGWRIAPLEHLSPTPANLVAGAATFVVGMFVVGSRWGDRRIEPLSGPVVPELEPPDGLPPAAADVLIHARSSRRDVTATIV